MGAPRREKYRARPDARRIRPRALRYARVAARWAVASVGGGGVAGNGNHVPGRPAGRGWRGGGETVGSGNRTARGREAAAPGILTLDRGGEWVTS